MRSSDSIDLTKRSWLMGLIGLLIGQRCFGSSPTGRPAYGNNAPGERLPTPGVHLPGVYRHCGSLSWEMQLAFEQSAVDKE
jgi:hypothetical protein